MERAIFFLRIYIYIFINCIFIIFKCTQIIIIRYNENYIDTISVWSADLINYMQVHYSVVIGIVNYYDYIKKKKKVMKILKCFRYQFRKTLYKEINQNLKKIF